MSDHPEQFCTCAALKGERIAPGVTRIRGNLCNVHGRYGPCDAAQGARATIDRNKRINAARAGQGGGKGRKPRAPRKTEAQRAAEREEQKRQRDAERDAKRVEADTARRAERDRLLSESGLSTQVRDALVDAAAGDNLAPQNGAELVKLGLAEQGEDGSYRLSPKGRQVVNAANRGDAGSLRDAMGEARDQTARGQRRATERITRQQQAAQRRQEAEARRAARGGGGGKKPEPKKAEPKPAPRRPAPRRSSGGGSRGPSASSSAGNVSRRVEARRRREERNQDAVRRTQERADRERQQTERTRVATPQLASAARTLSESGKVSDADADALIRNGLARRDRDGTLVLTATGLRAVRQKEHESGNQNNRGQERDNPANRQQEKIVLRGIDHVPSIPPSFAVFKDARGQWRWITRTTTAFEDRDGEVISIAALEKAVERMDARGNHGPLRWWHVGEPEPHNHEAPWGKGADLGWCDFSAVHGRTLIESGTFINEEVAMAVAAKADEIEVSPGLLHNRFTDPDPEKIYNDIDVFERSPIPLWGGRASNLFTGLTVEEPFMDQRKKEALLQLGLSEQSLAAVLGTAELKEKEADQAGIRYKDADPILAALKAWIGETVKEVLAAPVADEVPVVEEPAAATKDDGEGDMEVMAEEPEVEEQADGMEDVGGLTLSPEDITAIGEAVAAAIQASLAPLVGAMDMETKMRGHLNEIKGLFGNYTTTKDAETAQTKAKVENIDARLKELEGDQPAVQSTRPSRDPATAIRTDAELLAVVKAANNGAGPFDDIISNLGLGPQN